MLDEIEPEPNRFFSRYNAKAPEMGGCKKDSGGKDVITLRQEVVRQRENWAALQNEHLDKYGHEARVDHRSHRERGIAREPERHLGPAAICALTAKQKEGIQQYRAG